MEEERRCDYCHSKWQWTMPAYSKYEIFQVGCWSCFRVYNIVCGDYRLVNQSLEHFIFWKDLKRQWREAMKRSVSSVKKKDA